MRLPFILQIKNTAVFLGHKTLIPPRPSLSSKGRMKWKGGHLITWSMVHILLN